MAERLPQSDEWLMFGFDGVSFAVPNSANLQIHVTSRLLPDAPEGVLQRKDSRGNLLFALDGELNMQLPDPASSNLRELFVLLTSERGSFGLLCEWADSVRFDEQDLRILPIPDAMKDKGSPLSRLAIRRSADELELPVYLAETEDLVAYLQQLSGS